MTEQNTAPAETKPKAPKIEQNGVTRPKDGTTTGRVWAIADEISAKNGVPAERGDVIAAGKAEGINEATIATQHGKWRKFHGLKKLPKKAQPAEAAKSTETSTEGNQTTVE